MNDVLERYDLDPNRNKYLSDIVLINILKTIIGPGPYKGCYKQNTKAIQYEVDDVMIYFDTDLSTLDKNEYERNHLTDINRYFWNIEIYKCINAGSYTAPDTTNFKKLSLKECIY